MKRNYQTPSTEVAEVNLSQTVMIGLSEHGTEGGGGLSDEEVDEGLIPGRPAEWDEM